MPNAPRNARLRRLLRMRAELDALIRDEFEPWQATVYDYVTAHPGATSADVVKQFEVEQNHAATVLKQLADLGLLERAERRDENGKYFVYTRR